MSSENLQRLVEDLALWVDAIGRVEDAVYLLNGIQADDQAGDDGMAQGKFDGKCGPGVDGVS